MTSGAYSIIRIRSVGLDKNGVDIRRSLSGIDFYDKDASLLISHTLSQDINNWYFIYVVVQPGSGANSRIYVKAINPKTGNGNEESTTTSNVFITMTGTCLVRLGDTELISELAYIHGLIYDTEPLYNSINSYVQSNHLSSYFGHSSDYFGLIVRFN